MSELRRLVGAGLLIIAAGVIGLGGWTVLAPLSGAIVAPAFVKVDLNRKVVQHQEGGIVREIRVRDGDTVKQGQTLVVLEDVRVDSTLDLLSIQLIAEHAKETRLGAEATLAPKPVFPSDIVRRELELRIITARNSYKQNAVDELKDTTAHIFDLEERLRPSRDAAQRQQVLAPIAGEVVGLRVFTPGAVVGPRDVLMEIVPAEKTLILEARVRPEDINHVAKGIAADIRLTAYKQRTTPLVNGRVSYVSGDRLIDQENKNAPYYMAQIEVAPGALGDLKMQAGMPAEVYIRTDSR